MAAGDLIREFPAIDTVHTDDPGAGHGLVAGCALFDQLTRLDQSPVVALNPSRCCADLGALVATVG